MKDYMGSVAINNKARVAGFTSPRGNLVAFWHLDNQQPLGYHRLHDVGGIAVSHDQEHFVISNSSGQIRHIHALTFQETREKRLELPGIHWDNHLLSAHITDTA